LLHFERINLVKIVL